MTLTIYYNLEIIGLNVDSLVCPCHKKTIPVLGFVGWSVTLVSLTGKTESYSNANIEF